MDGSLPCCARMQEKEEEVQAEGRAFLSHCYPVQSEGEGLAVHYLRDISERKQTEERIRQAHERLRQSLEGTIRAIATAVEARDPYTAGHQRRVAALAAAIAMEMGLDVRTTEGIRLGAEIHDIGKIHVPAEILAKPGRLTDTEYALVKEHTQVGYDILKGIAFPWPVADIAHQHHERLDGLGYPQGLKGDAICLEARIVAVADVVEAMAMHRPYRPAVGVDAALAEIEKGKGRRYDPQAVDACLKLLADKRFTFDA